MGIQRLLPIGTRTSEGHSFPHTRPPRTSLYEKTVELHRVHVWLFLSLLVPTLLAWAKLLSLDRPIQL